MSYLMCSHNHMIDLETFKMVNCFGQRLTDEDVKVPFFMWWYYNSLHNLKRSYLMELNGFSVNFRESYRTSRHFFTRNQKAVITLQDKVRGEEVVLELVLHPSVRWPRDGRMKGRLNKDMKYEFTKDGNTQEIHSRLENNQSLFVPIQGLPKVDIRYHTEDTFSYGILPTQYTVMYRHKQLGGSCYALLCGPWGILLDDDFSFDSLVLLNGASQSILIVDRFLYTTNTYVIKFVTLQR